MSSERGEAEWPERCPWCNADFRDGFGMFGQYRDAGREGPWMKVTVTNRCRTCSGVISGPFHYAQEYRG